LSSVDDIYVLAFKNASFIYKEDVLILEELRISVSTFPRLKYPKSGPKLKLLIVKDDVTKFLVYPNAVLFNACVERYPKVPKPNVVEVRESTVRPEDRYPKVPNPSIVDTRVDSRKGVLIRFDAVERYPKVPNPSIVDAIPVLRLVICDPSP
jgi:hypothetical protein